MAIDPKSPEEIERRKELQQKGQGLKALIMSSQDGDPQKFLAELEKKEEPKRAGASAVDQPITAETQEPDVEINTRRKTRGLKKPGPKPLPEEEVMHSKTIRLTMTMIKAIERESDKERGTLADMARILIAEGLRARKIKV